MTAEGRLLRGKENYERKRFPNNPETLSYVESLKSKSKESKKNGNR